MKISKETLAVIKNFAGINSNLLITTGSKLSTINAHKNVLASAVVVEEFPIDFGIYDANEFLGVLSSFSDPDVEFSDKYAIITDGKSSVKYVAADKSVLTLPQKEIKFPATDVEFTLESAQLSSVMKMASILRATDVSIIGADGELSISVGDLKNVASNSFNINIGNTDKEFSANIRVENMKLMQQDYTVYVSSKKICKFEAVGSDLVVFIALEATSTF